jgi:hypothetical protein
MRSHLCRALTLAALALLGCRAKPLTEGELRKRLRKQSEQRAKFSSFAATYSLVLSGRRPGGKKGKLTCSGRIVAARGKGLRMRGSKALGMAKIFDFLMVGDRYRLSFLYGKKFYVGSVSKALAERRAQALVGGGKPELEALIFPVPPAKEWEKRELRVGRREAVLSWKRPDGKPSRLLVLDAATANPLRTEMFRPDGRRSVVIYYKKPAGAADAELRPVSGFKMRGAGEARFRMDFSFGKMAVNAPVKAAAFRLKAPPGVEVIDVDKRRAAKDKPAAEKR